MQHPNLRHWLPGLWAGVALFLAPALALGQGANKAQKVKFLSVDGVELTGHWYAAKGNNTAPCVLMVHDIGTNIEAKGWKNLAEALQGKGFAVLAFDLRGHGNSKGVQDDFWKVRLNTLGVKVRKFDPRKPPDSIYFKDFTKGYLPNLVNDIAAAKAFLDTKNDLGGCNSGNLIIIAEKKGAALAALWMKQEWYRHRITGRFIDPRIVATFEKSPEGKDIAAAIFLSYDPVVGASKLYPTRMLSMLGKEKSSAVAFFYADKDKASKDLATKAVKQLKGGKKKKTFVAAQAIKDAEKTTGIQLVAKGLKTEEYIIAYLENLMEERGASSVDTKEFKKTGYYWILPGRRPVLAKRPREDKLLYLIPVSLFAQ
jgi:hypothetical protein